MKVRASTLDDLLNEVFRRLIASGQETYPSKGKAFEVTGVVLELTNPRARMSRTEARAVIFSWLGEFLWYLAGNDDFSFIRYYIKDYKPDYKGATKVMAAYGPRLRAKNKDQLKWVVDLIKKKPDTRRAVIPIYQPKDTQANLPEVPCTCTLQFLLRGRRLELITHMRSNDAYVGLPGDIFAFTMIQEIIAMALNVEPGRYKHLVGSLHLYDADRRKAERYLAEGFQKKVAMPIMPLGDPFPQIETILRFERATRLGRHPRIPTDLPVYWQDLARLLSIFRAGKDDASAAMLRNMRKRMHSDAYIAYIEMRQQKAEKRETVPAVSAPELPFGVAPHA
ncbi:thymidylate synthase [Silvibacterium bohemicum]|uniref:thymidylate synthase n=1 Tax=Silvibacterium bohemicum TaxID=1577686 RepID=A0A841KAH7_9BACT|nr:thymidylate synthase [Silvibacterium bohemicum]MBB6147314.1 thymidylate synthase [Silvibacterium bohemicum]